MAKPGPRNLPAAPLMHGTGAFNAMWNLVLAGSVVTLVGRHFDPVELLDTIQQRPGEQHLHRRRRVRQAHPARPRRRARPLGHLVAAGHRQQRRHLGGRDQGRAAAPQRAADHDRQPGQQRGHRHGQQHHHRRQSAGTHRQVRARPEHARCSPRTAARCCPAAASAAGSRCAAARPIGYYKDEAKSADTFVLHDGVRWSIPGDWAEVEADGTLKLYGRGSQCINTGGEKVYPEEVEEALKLHPSVDDAAVVGVPDERFGEAITALVEAHAGDTIDEAALIAHVRTTPRRTTRRRSACLPIATVGRAANGKLDYKSLKAEALRQLGLA